MAINRYSQVAPMDFALTETPLEPLMMALKARQQRYDTAYKMAGDIEEQAISSLPQDTQRAQEKMEGWRSRIDEMVAEKQGDYSAIFKDLDMLRREVVRDFKPGGEANAIQTNLSNFQEADKRELERLAKGDVTQDTYNLWRQAQMKGYTGVGPQDPITKQYNQFNPEVIAQYVNIDDDLHKALKNLAEEAGGKETVHIGGQWLTKVGNKWEIIDPERVQSIAASIMVNNQKYSNMITQQAKWLGVDPKEALIQDISSRAATMSNIYAKDNRWSTQDVSINRYGLLDKMMQELTPPGQTTRGPVENIPGTDPMDPKRGWFGRLFVDRTEASRAKNYEGWVDQKATEIPEGVMRSAYTQIVDRHKAKGLKGEQLTAAVAGDWNKAVTSLGETFPHSHVLFTQEMLKQYGPGWKGGGAQKAIYREIKPDGTLGKQMNFRDAKIDPEKDLPQSIGYVGGEWGTVINAGIKTGVYYGSAPPKNYLVTNAPWDDKAMKSGMSALAAFTAPLMGTTGPIVRDVNMPIKEPQTGRISGYSPAQVTSRTTFNGVSFKPHIEISFFDGSKQILTDSQGIFLGPGGKVLDRVPGNMVTQTYGAVLDAVSAEMNRNIGWSNLFNQAGSRKGEYDAAQLILGGE